MAGIVRAAAGPHLESVRFVDQYRGQQIPAGKKSYVIGLTYRAADRTLSGEEVYATQAAVLKVMQDQVGAVQRHEIRLSSNCLLCESKPISSRVQDIPS